MTPYELRQLDIRLRAAVHALREARSELYGVAGVLEKPAVVALVQANIDHAVALPVDTVRLITLLAHMSGEMNALGDAAESVAQRVSRTRGSIMKAGLVRQPTAAAAAAAAKEAGK